MVITDVDFVKELLTFLGFSNGMNWVYFVVAVTAMGFVGLEFFNLFFKTKYTDAWKKLQISSKLMLSFLIGLFSFYISFSFGNVIPLMLKVPRLQIEYNILFTISLITFICWLSAGKEIERNNEIKVYVKTLAVLLVGFLFILTIIGFLALAVSKQWLTFATLILLLIAGINLLLMERK